MEIMPRPEYECKRCSKVFSIEEYSKSVFCPSCGSHLWPKRIKGIYPRKKETGIELVSLTPDQINVHTLFAEFLQLHDFNCGEGIILDNVPSWITDRRKAYAEFRDKFSQDKLVNWEKLGDDFRQFLYFKNNLSWTTLYRSGLKALSDIERLWKLLTFVQDESVDVEVRVRQGLQGAYYCQGIGRNILTALLHTFNPDKYGVWNSRTEDTLKIIRRTPRPIFDAGKKYQAINNELTQLGAELDTDLTTIDGFMWFISKKVKILE
jgi:DNA-directed RNA polymerase subunit RPC12/RpoP